MSPEEIGKMVDEWDSTRTQRLSADKVAAELKQKETLLHEQIVRWLLENKLTATGGKVMRVGLEKKDTYVAKDWSLIHEFMRMRNDFSIVHRRLTQEAIMEHAQAGDPVPGVEVFPVYRLSRSKARA